MKSNLTVTFIFLFLITQAVSAKPFNMLIWNIKKSNNNEWAKHFQKITNNIDFVLIQEATDQEIIIEAMNLNFKHHRFYKSWSNKEYTTGIVNASRVSPYYTHSYISPVTEPIVQTPKVISLEKIKRDAQDLLIINIHAINFRLLKAFKKHITQIDEDLKNHDGPVIFAGDFNTWSKSRKDFLDSYLGSYQIKEVPIKRVYSGLHLDHIYTRGLNNIRAKQLEKKSTSDHYPLVLYVK
jgi:endonuclease/exonuclease/phosphatase (EEP) superfamily protein YafD